MEAVWPGSWPELSHRRTKASVATGYTRFQDGDVLVPKITPTFEAGRSILVGGLFNGVGAGTTELHVLRPGPQLDPRFLLYTVSTHGFLKLGAASMYGVAGQQRVPDEFLRDLEIDLPSLEGQRRTADFLDAETARIARIKLARRKQLDLIEECALSRAFAAIRGLWEPGARVDSGLSWLGDVPHGWSIAPVWSQFDVQLGKMLNQERVNGGSLKPYLRNTNVQWDRIFTEDLLLMNFPSHERQRYEVLPGDLLICEGGEPGRAAIWNGAMQEVYYQKALHRARSRGVSSVRWLFYCLRVATARNVFAVEGNTTTIAHLTGEQLRSHRFPFPEQVVQSRLTKQLDEAGESDQQFVRAAEVQLDLLAEWRQALITAAVTGQMDVTTARGVDV